MTLAVIQNLLRKDANDIQRPEAKIKVFAEQEDVSLEYCNAPDANTDCVLTVDGRPVRHIRLDCSVALVDEKRAFAVGMMSRT